MTDYNDKPYQVMPDLSPEEFEALKDDIAARGVMVPIELDEDGNILDGHHRIRACAELGITDYPTVTREGMTEDEKLLHAFTLNTARRHLTREQKERAAKEILRRCPKLSDRQVGKAVGISHPTVGKYRREMEESGQLEKVTSCVGADGRERPRPMAYTSPTADDQPDTPSPDSKVSEWLEEMRTHRVKLSALMMKAIDDAVERGDVETIKAVRWEALMMDAYYSGLYSDLFYRIEELKDGGTDLSEAND